SVGNLGAVAPPILSLSATELEQWLVDHGAPTYRRKQIWDWLARGATIFEAMVDVPKALRGALDTAFRATSLRPIAVSEADGGLPRRGRFGAQARRPRPPRHQPAPDRGLDQRPDPAHHPARRGKNSSHPRDLPPCGARRAA